MFRICSEYRRLFSTMLTPLQNSIKRYPYFNVCLRRGIFWHYLEELDGKPTVTPDSDVLIKDIDSIETYGYTFRVSYYRNKFSIDCFHALCDGNGCMEFFKTVLYEYLRLSGQSVDAGDKIRLPQYSHGAGAEILQIAYRRTDNIKFSAHYLILSSYPSA